MIKRLVLALIALSPTLYFFMVSHYEYDFWGICLSIVIIFYIFPNIYLLFSKNFDRYPLERKYVTGFKKINNIYFMIFLGYIMIGLLVPNIISFVSLFILMVFVVTCGGFYYFNSMLFLFGYNFYILDQDDKTKFILITKRNIKTLDDLFVYNKYTIGIYQIDYGVYIYFA